LQIVQRSSCSDSCFETSGARWSCFAGTVQNAALLQWVNDFCAARATSWSWASGRVRIVCSSLLTDAAHDFAAVSLTPPHATSDVPAIRRASTNAHSFMTGTYRVTTRSTRYPAGVGSAGKAKRSGKKKPKQHLPKVQGNSGKLWGEEPVPWGPGENLERTVGRAGPQAQAAFFGRHGRGVVLGVRIAAVTVFGVIVVGTLVNIVR
jgi:hypothetical protein